MAIDYVSSSAWNNPFNPWPRYSQIYLSAADTFTPGGTDYIAPPGLVLNLMYFNPVEYSTYPTGGASTICYYRSFASNMILFKDINRWNIYEENEEVYYYKSKRNINEVPFNQAGVSVSSLWEPFGYGQHTSSIYIAPVLSSITPWEKRRIAGGAF